MRNIIISNLNTYLKSKQFDKAIIEYGSGLKSFYSFTHYYNNNKHINIYQDDNFVFLQFSQNNTILYRDSYKKNNPLEDTYELIMFEVQVYYQDFF